MDCFIGALLWIMDLDFKARKYGRYRPSFVWAMNDPMFLFVCMNFLKVIEGEGV